MSKRKLTIIILSIAAMVFLLTDCVCGTSRRFPSKVINRHYEPAWTQFVTSTDDKGRVTTSTIHHPEQFHLICVTEDWSENLTFDCLSTRQQYYTITNNQAVTVWTRHGRFTGVNWMPTIE